MGIVTIEKLENADKDADALDDFVSGNGKEKVKTRKGVEYLTAPGVEKVLLDNGLKRGFANKVELDKYTPSIIGSLAQDMETKKVYMWDGKWNDTGKSELDLAKEFTKNNTLSSSKIEDENSAVVFTDATGRATKLSIDKDGNIGNDTAESVEYKLTNRGVNTLLKAESIKDGKDDLITTDAIGRVYNSNSEEVIIPTTPAEYDLTSWTFHGSSSMYRCQDDVFSKLQNNFDTIEKSGMYGLGGSYFSYAAATIGRVFSGGGLIFSGGSVGLDSAVIPENWVWGKPGGGSATINSKLNLKLSNGIVGDYLFSQDKFQSSEILTVDKDTLIDVIHEKEILFKRSCAFVNLAKNDVQTSVTLDDLLKMNIEAIDYLDAQNSEHTLILGHFSSRGYSAENVEKIEKINAVLRSKYYSRFIDINEYILGDQVWIDLNTQKTEADIASINRRQLPPSLSIDSSHFNADMNSRIADFVVEKVQQLGWYK